MGSALSRLARRDTALPRAVFAAWVALGCAGWVVLPAPARAVADEGLVFELSLQDYELQILDVRSGERAPAIRVTHGSPASPTPSGSYRLGRIILNPAWHPGADAVAAGALPEAPSLTTPMGVGKIPFAAGGAIALHGGAHRDLLGKPVSGGCVRTADADFLRMVAWLHGQQALAEPVHRRDGEVHRSFRRPARLVVR